MPVGSVWASPLEPTTNRVFTWECEFITTNDFVLFSTFSDLDWCFICNLSKGHWFSRTCRWGSLCSEESVELIGVVDWSTRTSLVEDRGDLPVESWITELLSCKHKLKVLDYWMGNIELNTSGCCVTEFNESNWSLKVSVMWVENISP